MMVYQLNLIETLERGRLNIFERIRIDSLINVLRIQHCCMLLQGSSSTFTKENSCVPAKTLSVLNAH